MIITVSRQIGTDSRRVLTMLSQQLGIPILDRNAVESAAECLGIVNAGAESAEDERLPSSVTRLRRMLAGTKHYATALTRAVQELGHRQSAILVGAAGATILRDSTQAVHLRFIARREDRIQRISKQSNIDDKRASLLIDESDRQRMEFHSTLFNLEWEDPHHYHAILNTSLLYPEQSVALIMLTLKALNLIAAVQWEYTAPTSYRYVTISREYGSGGHDFCERLANTMGWACFDHELLHRSAALSGVPLPALIRIDEHGPGFIERLNTMQESARYFEGLCKAIAQAGKTPSVIVGRGGYMLFPSDEALHLRFVAATHDRVLRTMQEHWLARDAARSLVHEQDLARASFHRHYFRVDWSDPTLYHAVVNTSRIELDSLVEITANFLRSGHQQQSEK